MRAIATIIGIITPATSFASYGLVDDSGIFVWVFLGFCTKLFIAQAVTAFLLIVGMVKGVASEVKD